MFLFYEFILDYDGVAQDIEILTYDLNKWYFLPWDKDTTFGMFWDSTGLIENSENLLLFNYVKEDSSQMLWYKTYKSFKKDIEIRYAELRNKGVFTMDNINKLSEEVYSKISEDIWVKELNLWKDLDRPTLEETNKAQILDWVNKRLILLDNLYNYKDN